MDEKIINEKSLEMVTGGAGNVQPDRKSEFEQAWYGLNMEAKGLTGTELEDLYTQWQEAGFKPDARTFLSNCKTI